MAVGSKGDGKQVERIQHFEQKLLAQQEELTELHRRKGDHVQQIIDLNTKLQEKEKLLSSKDLRYVSCFLNFHVVKLPQMKSFLLDLVFKEKELAGRMFHVIISCIIYVSV